jgi:hypothetical protein
MINLTQNLHLVIFYEAFFSLADNAHKYDLLELPGLCLSKQQWMVFIFISLTHDINKSLKND